jgi:hypothetical protein
MWTYQFVRSVDEELDEEVLILAEVYKDSEGVPYGWCKASIVGDDMREVKAVYQMLSDAFDKPILTDKDFVGDPFV